MSATIEYTRRTGDCHTFVEGRGMVAIILSCPDGSWHVEPAYRAPDVFTHFDLLPGFKISGTEAQAVEAALKALENAFCVRHPADCKVRAPGSRLCSKCLPMETPLDRVGNSTKPFAYDKFGSPLYCTCGWALHRAPDGQTSCERPGCQTST